MRKPTLIAYATLLAMGSLIHAPVAFGEPSVIRITDQNGSPQVIQQIAQQEQTPSNVSEKPALPAADTNTEALPPPASPASNAPANPEGTTSSDETAPAEPDSGSSVPAPAPAPSSSTPSCTSQGCMLGSSAPAVSGCVSSTGNCAQHGSPSAPYHQAGGCPHCQGAGSQGSGIDIQSALNGGNCPHCRMGLGSPRGLLGGLGHHHGYPTSCPYHNQHFVHGCQACALVKQGHLLGAAGAILRKGADHFIRPDTRHPGRFGYFMPRDPAGHHIHRVGLYHMVYPVNPGYFDARDNYLYATEKYGVPMTVPLAPVVKHAYNYGWGIPSSRLTPLYRWRQDRYPVGDAHNYFHNVSYPPVNATVIGNPNSVITPIPDPVLSLPSDASSPETGTP